jgi:hypothetical protein
MDVNIKIGRDIILEPSDQQPRQHWAKAAELMHHRGDDELLLPDVFEDEIECFA